MPEPVSETMEITPQNDPNPLPQPEVLQSKATELDGEEGGEGDLEELEEIQPSTSRKRERTPAKPKPPTVPGWTPVTEPRYKAFYSDHNNPHQKTRAGYTYWNSLTSPQRERIDAYVYRDWPVLKPVPDETKEYGYIDKILGIEPLQDDNDLLDKYGSGDYHIFLNQDLPPEVAKEMKQAAKRTLCTFYIRGGRDMKSRPPCDKRVVDIDQVDLLDPANKSYIEFLRMAGKLPEQQKGKELEAEMATVQTIDRMAESNKDMMKEVINMAKESRKEQAPAADALKSALEVVTDGAKKSNQMLHDTIASIQEMRRAEGEGRSESSGNLEVMMKMAMDLAEKLAGKSSPDSSVMDEVRSLRTQVAEMQNARIAGLERRLEEATKAPVVAANPATQFSSIKEGINAFKEMKGLVDEVSGKSSGGGEGEGDGGMGGPGWLRTVGGAMPHIASVASSVRDLLAIWNLGNQRGTGMQMPPAQPQPQVFQQPPQSQPMPQPGLTGAGPQLVAPQPQPQPIPVSNPYGLPPDVADLLSSIKISLLNHLEGSVSGDLTGAEFADWFIGGFGEDIFKQVAKYGGPMLLQAIYAYPPIAERLPATGASQEQVTKFVREFVEFKMEDVEGDGEPPVSPEPIPPAGGAA